MKPETKNSAKAKPIPEPQNGINNVSPIWGLFEYFVCGGVGGVFTVLTGHPFDTIKVRMQMMPTPAPGQAPLYRNALHCAAKIVKYEGFVGLYKGMTAPLIALAPIFALNFLAYKAGKNIVHPDSSTRITLPEYFAAGAFSAVLTTVIMAPGEHIKILLQMQTDASHRIYNGFFDCLVKLFKQGGVPLVYKGSMATLARDMPATGAYFVAYESVYNYCTNYGEVPISSPMAMVGGGCAGLAYWAVGMPMDRTKTHVQASRDGKLTFRKHFAHTLIKGPWKNFYKGFTPVVIRSFPANASCFFGFELTRRYVFNDK